MAKAKGISRETIENVEVLADLGQYGDFFTRLKDTLIGGDIFKNIAEWIVNNTRLRGRQFSFDEHEFQIDIAGSPAQEGCVKKCSQVGLTELAVRIALAWLAISDGRSLIYVLPTSKFAGKFSKSRIDPIISSSPKLKDLVVPAADSSDLKRIGNSFLYINGAADDSQAISVPAEGLLVDERDFCNPAVLSTYDSRSRHARDEKFQRRFSTPTVDGYGIDEDYSMSSKKRYLVKCKHCEKWACPDFARDVVIPGYEDDFLNFDKEDAVNENYRIKDAYIACHHCRRSLDSSLADPARREWVAEFPSRAYVGWWVHPFDLIAYNQTPNILDQRRKYTTMQGYMNFVLGCAYTAKNARMNIELIKKLTAMMEQMQANGTCIGIDVGKTCYVIVGKKIGKVYTIFRMARVRQTMQESLFKQLSGIIDTYKGAAIVIDAGPEFSLVRELKVKYGSKLFPCVYVEDAPKLPNYYEVSKLEKNEGTISAQRTKGFDSLVEEFNKENFILPKSNESEEFKQHIQGMKRVSHENEEGELISRWVKTGPDHYFHSLFYFKLACDLLSEGLNSQEPAGPAMVSGVIIGGKQNGQLPNGVNGGRPESDIRRMMGRFGVR